MTIKDIFAKIVPKNFRNTSEIDVKIVPKICRIFYKMGVIIQNGFLSKGKNPL